MKARSEKQIKISKRREKISTWMISKNESELAGLVGVCLRTVVSDVAILKQSANEWVNKLPQFLVVHEFKSVLARSTERKEILKKSLDSTTNVFEMAVLTKELRAEDQFTIELLGKAPTVYALKMLMEKANAQGS